MTVCVVMGVAGSGKSTIGTLLADRLSVAYQDGDDLHPQANVDKMAGGHPLTDADRAPWLDRVAGWIDRHRDSGGVIACSALKRAYRDALRRPFVAFIHLDVPKDELRRRLRRRAGHFMKADLLESQLADLEPPDAEERVVTLDASRTPTEVASAAASELARL